MRVLVIPAAGRGSRLGGTIPKAMVPVNGRPMLAWLADLYRPMVDALVIVAHSTTRDTISDEVASYGLPFAVTVQPEPTGMLDAVVLGCEAAEQWSPDRVWVTWCDQVAVHPETTARLAAAEARTVAVTVSCLRFAAGLVTCHTR